MFNQDIIVTNHNDTHQIFFLVTPKGDEAARAAHGMAVEKMDSPGLSFYETPIKSGNRDYDKFRKQGLDIQFIVEDEMSYEEVEFNARAMAFENERKAFIADLARYYEPLFNKALDEKDGKEAARLFRSMPQIMAVEKSFLIMSIKKTFGVSSIDDLG